MCAAQCGCRRACVVVAAVRERWREREEEKEGEGALGMHKMKGLERISPKMRLPRPLVQQFMSNFYEEEHRQSNRI